MSEDRRAVVEDLNRLMAEETEACLRYFQMRFRLRGKARRAAERFFEDALKETLDHGDAIAKQIHALGHIPTLHINLSLGGGPMRPEEALAEALDAYAEFLPRVTGDPVLEEFIRRQIEIETEHVPEIREVVGAGESLKLVARPPAASGRSLETPTIDIWVMC